MIQLTDLSFTYEEGLVGLNNLNVTIKTGECVVLCGESGCGKTTFTRTLNGLVPELYEGDFSGEGTVADLRINQTPIDQFSRQVGSVFQNPKTQFFTNDVLSELVFGCENLGISREIMEQRLTAVQELFPIAHLMEKGMHELSGGEKQLIAFASAYMIDPNYLVLDEPSSNLDYQTIEILREQILKLKKLGKTIILSEHRLYYLKDLADRYLYIVAGKVMKEYSSEEIKQLTRKDLVRLGLRVLDFQSLEVPIQLDLPNPAITSLELKNIKYRYKRKAQNVIDIPDLTLDNQQIIGLVGANGAGKSTFVKVLSGLLKTQGQVLRDGKSCTKRELIDQSYLVMQDVNYQLFCETVAKELQLNAKRPELFQEVVENFDLVELLERHPMSLSGGQKQRVAIATAVLSGKSIIFLDEPTSGLDARHMEEVHQYLRKLHQAGLIIVIISHDIEFLTKACSRILYLSDKKIQADFSLTETPEDLFKIFSSLQQKK